MGQEADRIGEQHPRIIDSACGTGTARVLGDRMSAAGASYVGVTLHGDTRLAIGPGSELAIREFEFNPSSYAGAFAISFLRGTARIITGIIAKHMPERVKFNTPTMTIGIRCTDFIVHLEEQ
jgi:hypothetical protein